MYIMRQSIEKLSQYYILFTVVFVLLLCCVSAKGSQIGYDSEKVSQFDLEFDNQGISSLKRKNDIYNTNYIFKGEQLGDVVVRFRQSDGRWTTLSTKLMAQKNKLKAKLNNKKFITTTARKGVKLKVIFLLEGKRLIWNIVLKNNNPYPVQIGDVALPLPMNNNWSWEKKVTYTRRVIRHSTASGNNSFLFWMRADTKGPYLLMTPIGDTHLEYYDDSTTNEKGHSFYTVYVHSLAQRKVIKQHGGNWRQPHTGVMLRPSGRRGDYWKAGFKLQWAINYKAVRKELYEDGLFNIRTIPGMTVPIELPVKIALKNKFPIHKVKAEFPKSTSVHYVRKTNDGYHIYKIKFNKLGENKLTVEYGSQRKFYLQYFITQPIATLIKKRARFLVNREQIRNSGKWYEGLFSDWSMKNEWLLKPDNLHNIPQGRQYMISSDDPALGRVAFLAKKNVIYPVQKQVRALDYYISKFVWGGLQMTKKEAYPYAIYGIPNWKVNRESSDPGLGGRTHIWRIYDYPHVVQMYLSMYRIARYYPGIKTKLTADEYLRRAYNTAVDFYTIPKEVKGWSAYKVGCYDEVAILGVIHELKKDRQSIKARRLLHFWEQKVSKFVNGNVDLFASEYPFDTTNFESTGAFARYAMSVAGRPQKKGDLLRLNVSKKKAQNFMEKQVNFNVGSRGWLEKAYYLYGSDYRGGENDHYMLSYMAQMGGESLLDYSLYFSPDPYKYLRLSYGSLLSSWALMNTGTKQSNYGFWYPGKINDGGAGGGFEPLAFTTTWLGQSQGRGPWYYGSEIDLGFTGYLRASAMILADDPVFGMTAFGGVLKKEGNDYKIIPKDGVRRRLHLLWDHQKVHLTLKYACFEADKPIIASHSFDNISFYLADPGQSPHPGLLLIKGLPKGKYSIMVNRKTVSTFNSDSSKKMKITFPVEPVFQRVEISRRD